MSLSQFTNQGPSFVPAYQVSGVPFVTSSNGNEVSTTPIRVTFPFVTRFFQVTNTSSANLRIGFSAAGVNATGATSGSSGLPAHKKAADHRNYFVLGTSGSNGGGTIRLEVRCKELWFRRDGTADVGFTLIAGLTGVQPSAFPVLTGSNGFEGVG